MKNVSKRTKMILAIVGIVIVIAVIGLVATQPPMSALFGTASNLVITPSNPIIIQGNTMTLTVNGPYQCNWQYGNSNVVSFVPAGAQSNVSTVTVKGIAPGQSLIYANCNVGYVMGQITWIQIATTVTVNPPPTPTRRPDGPDGGRF